MSKKIIYEILMASDYEITTTIQSIIDPTKTILREPEVYDCPKCKKDSSLGKIKHGEMVICKKCGLKATLYGNALHCKLIIKE